MFATPIARIATITIAIRAISTELSIRLPILIAPILLGPYISDIRITMSCPATDDTAQRMLSTVEISPERISKKNRYKNHFGVNAITAPTLTSWVSAIGNCAPAAKKPKHDKEIGTTAKIKAAVTIVRLTCCGFTQKTRCQNIWSPNVPESRPIVVGRPNESITAIPVLSNRCR